jgi:hypothetical protein
MVAVAAGLERASTMIGLDNRELGPGGGETAALLARGVPETTAHLAGELGVLAFKQGYARWSETDQHDGRGLAEYALSALDELRTASRSLD